MSGLPGKIVVTVIVCALIYLFITYVVIPLVLHSKRVWHIYVIVLVGVFLPTIVLYDLVTNVWGL